jgi:hypothetical protein
MTISELKKHLTDLTELKFILPDGRAVPAHFHITEVGRIQRHFIDCGGTERMEQSINLQLWVADDLEHRLTPSKLLSIISQAESRLGLPDVKVEVEFQESTIQKFGLQHFNEYFLLVSTQTACLAEDACVVTPVKEKRSLTDLGKGNPTCTPGSGCC